MTAVTVNVKLEFFEDLLEEAVEEAMVPVLMQCGMMVQVEAQKGLSVDGGKPKKKRTGRAYEYYNRARGGYVIASTPPDPPHTQTGNLKNSITVAMTTKRTVIVGPTRMAWYGKVHEKGKRPFMIPALKRAAPRFERFCRFYLARTRAGRELNSRRNPR